METPFSYDAIEYQNMMYVQTHIERMAILSRLYGFNPCDTSACRVLEVGCGDGWNLMPMALQYPNSQFFGLDMAKTMIEAGQARIQKYGISNFTLAHLDLTNLTEEWGQFDYIIAHGFYSWVPPSVREKLLEVCQNRLTENGVAYISYKAYPGAYFFQITRDMMQFHAESQHFTDLIEQVEQGRAMLDMTKNALPRPDNDFFQSRYIKYLQDEVALFDFSPNYYILHDFLADFSQPFYFVDFMKAAAEHHLQFVAESDFVVMQPNSFSPLAQNLLKALESRPVIREQYIDYFLGRSFRTTLLSHDTHKRLHSPNHEALFDVHFIANLHLEKQADDPNEIIIEWKERRKITTSHILVKRIASILSQYYPQSISFKQLHEFMRPLLIKDTSFIDNDSAQCALLAQLLLDLYGEGLMEIFTSPTQATRSLPERPIALPIAQICASENRRHLVDAFHSDVLCEDEVVRELLKILDGTKTIAELALLLNQDETKVQESLDWLLQHGMVTDKN